MRQNPIFVILRFSRSVNSTGVDLLLLHSGDGTGLRVWVPPDWAQHVDRSDHAYLSALMDEWEQASNERVAIILSELSKHPHPLRILQAGEMSTTDCTLLPALFTDYGEFTS